MMTHFTGGLSLVRLEKTQLDWQTNHCIQNISSERKLIAYIIILETFLMVDTSFIYSSADVQIGRMAL